MTESERTTYEENLHWLLTLMQGKRYPYSKGLVSYKTDDPEHQGLHQACLELERRGALVRAQDDAQMTAWMPVEV